MDAAATRFEFTPPPPPGSARALGIALLAHALLLAALTWGVHWKRDANELAVQAELWSALPQEAAPKLEEAPPPPPPPPPEPVQPQVQPKPVEQADADIALARQKKELEKKEAEKKATEKLAQEKAKKAQLEREQKKKAEEEKKRLDEKQAKQEAQRKEAAKAEKELEAQRQANLRRIQGLAGATGEANAQGNAQRSAGPSASYAGRIKARIKPNIVFTDDVPGNPVAEVEVRTAPDGTIVGRKLQKSSGVKAWDEAVLKAIDKTETLPRDEDGRVPALLVISFKPRD